MELLARSTPEAIASIYGIGEEIAQSIYAWFRKPTNQNLIERLQASGLQFVSVPKESKAIAINPHITGKTFVVTGTLPTLKRDEAKALIQAQGGKVSTRPPANALRIQPVDDLLADGKHLPCAVRHRLPGPDILS